MSKIYLVSMSLELHDDAPNPCEDQWASIAANAVSGITGIGNISFEQLPGTCLEDCPANNVLH